MYIGNYKCFKLIDDRIKTNDVFITAAGVRYS